MTHVTDTQREAFEAWQKDPRFYQWNTTDEHAELNFEAGYQAAQAALSGAAQDVARAPLQVEISPIVMVGSPNACQVWLNRGAQQFAVGNPHETREDGEWFADMLRKAIAPAAPAVAPEQSQSMSRHSRAMLLNVLWHHQGGSSQVGQPIRRLLGIKPHARLNDEELAEAKWIDGLLAAPAQAEQRGDGGIRDALAGMLKWFGKYPEFIPDWPAQADKVKAAIENANAALSSTERPSARVAKSGDSK